VSRVLAAHFKTYLLAMEKMAAPVAGQGDVLGVLPEGAGGGGAMGQFGGSVMSAMSGAMGLFGKAQGRATSVSSQGSGARCTHAPVVALGLMPLAAPLAQFQRGGGVRGTDLWLALPCRRTCIWHARVPSCPRMLP
jgi:hypothetical protein